MASLTMRLRTVNGDEESGAPRSVEDRAWVMRRGRCLTGHRVSCLFASQRRPSSKFRLGLRLTSSECLCVLRIGTMLATSRLSPFRRIGKSMLIQQALQSRARPCSIRIEYRLQVRCFEGALDPRFNGPHVRGENALPKRAG